MQCVEAFRRPVCTVAEAVAGLVRDTENASWPLGRVTMSAASTPAKVSGMVLTVIVGLLNFHIHTS